MPKPRHSQTSRPAAKKPTAAARPKAHPAVKGKKAPHKNTSKPARALAAAHARVVAAAGKKAPKNGPLSKAAPVAAVSAGPSPRDLAVDAFEHGFQALQVRQYARAAEFLASVVNGYPDEKELQERARVYLNICERQKLMREPAPRSFDERVNAATIAINRGAVDEGLSLLRKLEAEDRTSDHVQYMLSVAHTQAGDTANALLHLRQAVELNPENRFLATQDADLEDLRRAEGFLALLEAPLPARRKQLARKR